MLSQPKYGFSASRPSELQTSRAPAKFSLLRETQTPHEKTSSLPITGISIRPRMKKCWPLITHWSDDSMLFGSLSKLGSQTSGAMVE
ncbi:hypothetical protein SMICM304S_11539 [Streptomyces microflavus]